MGVAKGLAFSPKFIGSPIERPILIETRPRITTGKMKSMSLGQAGSPKELLPIPRVSFWQTMELLRLGSLTTTSNMPVYWSSDLSTLDCIV